MDTQTGGLGASLLRCPQSKMLALGALGKREGPGALTGDPRRGGSGHSGFAQSRKVRYLKKLNKTVMSLMPMEFH